MTPSNVIPQDDRTGTLPGDTGVMTVSPDGRPMTRFLTAEGVYNTLNAMLLSDAADAQRRALIQGMIDGNPPYRQSELQKAGLGELVNINWLGLRGSLESRLSIIDQMVGMDTRLIEVTPKNPGPAPADLQDIGDVIADQFSVAVHDWNGLPALLEAVMRDMDSHGLGVAMFAQKNDWRPISVPRGSVRTAENSRIEIDDNEVIGIEGTLQAGDLFRVLEQKTVGWDLETTREYLVQTFVEKVDNTSQGGNDRGTTLVESFEARMRDNVWYDSNQFKEIRVVHVYSREVDPDGGITHIIVPANRVGTIGWLYREEKVYENLSDVVWFLPSVSSADGRLRSLRGIASYLAPISHLDNQFLCHIFDIGWRSSSFVLQPASRVDMAAMRFVEHGPYTILPPELKVVPNALPAAGLSSLISLRELAQNVGQNNALGLKLSQGTPFPEHPAGSIKGEGKNAQKELQMAQQAVMNADRHGAAVRLRAIAALFRKMFQRMLEIPLAKMPPPARKIAEEFRKACLARNVTEEQFDKFEELFAINLSRELMMGGAAAYVQAMGALMQMRSGMDEEGGVRIMRDILSQIVGRRNVDRYRPMLSRENLSTSAKSFATLENNSIIAGHAPKAGRDQLHRAHIEVHMQLVQPIMQAAQQGQLQDYAKAFQTLQLVVQHLVEHIQLLGSDPAFEAEADAMMKKLKPVFEMLKRLEDAAKKQAEAQAEAQQAQAGAAKAQAEATQQLGSLNGQQLSPELMLKKYEIEKKDVISRMEQESLNKMRADKTVVQNQIKMQEAQNNMAIARMVAGSKAQTGAAPQAPVETGPGDEGF